MDEIMDDVLSSFWRYMEDVDDPIEFIDRVQLELDAIRYSFEENEEREPMICKDCKEDADDEYYMVHNQLWYDLKGGDGFLCVGCFERRLGRKLNPQDFTSAPINNLDFPWDRSDRLIDRLTGPVGREV